MPGGIPKHRERLLGASSEGCTILSIMLANKRAHMQHIDQSTIVKDELSHECIAW